MRKPPSRPRTTPAFERAAWSDPDVAVVSSLGLDLEPAAFPSGAMKPSAVPMQWPEGNECFVTVCTTNYVRYARTLHASILRQYRQALLIVAVVDAESRNDVDLPGATILTGRDVFGANLDYFALKYDATELCCAAKPFTLSLIMQQAHYAKLIYLDADIYVFAPLDEMIRALDVSDFAVTPHTLAPMPAPERFWERPSLGDLAYAGVMNAGMFGARRQESALRFIETWKTMVTTPGAFLSSQGGQTEQHSFNWITAFADSVHVIRDPCYNVAYWNLHDRSVRFTAAENTPTVDGRPLVTFHFSGFSADDPTTFSKYDHRRQMLFELPSVTRLCRMYADEVLANDHGESWLPYRFHAFPSGIVIDRRMREIFKEHEMYLRTTLDPWTPEGEFHYCRALLSPVPYVSGPLPVIAHEIFRERTDILQRHDNRLENPIGLLKWFLEHGVHDYGYERLADWYRPALPSAHGALVFTMLARRSPALLAGIGRPLREGRQRLIMRLQTHAPEIAAQVRDGAVEYPFVSSILAVQFLLKERPDVEAAFPDLLFEDATHFINWLRHNRTTVHFLSPEIIDSFADRANGRSLARIFAYLTGNWQLMDQYPLGLVGVDATRLATQLLQVLRHGASFDFEDILMLLWVMRKKPWAGLALTFELPANATRRPSPRTIEGQEELLRPLLKDPRFTSALAAYREQYPAIEEPKTAGVVVRNWRSISVASLARNDKKELSPNGRSSLRPGVNVFGYHRSSIGLGYMSQGLCAALELAGEHVSRVVVGNDSMDDGIVPDDFIRRYDYALGTNIFVSYPHLRELLLRTVPDDVVEGRRNVAYLAWEQREGNDLWQRAYADFDQVWALSEFAATSLAKIMHRDVHALPCVVDSRSFPAPVRKEDASIDPSQFTFLYVFDANSCTERKNPEAAVRAFQRSFRRSDNVRLLIKISNGRRAEHKPRVGRLIDLANGNDRIELRMESLQRTEMLGLVSAADAYISLHRAEGFGYTCAEAMAYAKPVIATGYSGNLHFMNESNSYLVRYDEVDVREPEGPFQRGSLWAEPDITHAAELMRHVYESRDEAARKGECARRTIERELSPAAVAKKVQALIGETRS